MKSLRQNILEYAAREYDTHPEHLWKSYPNYEVFRHSDNQKWFGILMDVRRESLGLSGQGFVDILNVKLDTSMVDILRTQSGYLPAYHMNKKYWLSICLDGSVTLENIYSLLDQSFSMTDSKKQGKHRTHVGPRDWLIPANPIYYDVIRGFEEKETLYWTQSSNVQIGDTIYMYVAAPYSAIMFKCIAEEVDVYRKQSFHSSDLKRLMRIRLLHTYDSSFMPLKRLRNEFGVYGVRGPRSVPNSLKYELDLYAQN